MLKKLRWRITGAAMLAFAAVILSIVATVNFLNYRMTVRQADETLEILSELDAAGNTDRIFEMELPGTAPAAPGGPSGEMPYTLRYFIVHCDAEGAVTDVYQEYIASITRQDAENYALAVLAQGDASGYYRGYRFLRTQTDGGSTVVFLNEEQELQFMNNLLLLSGSIAVGSLAAVFVLVLLLSGRVARPFVRNLETQRRFVTDASHELKTPLTSISASAEVLAMDLPDNEWVRNIQSQTARMARLVGELVALSRLDEAQPVAERTEFSFSDAVWEISEPFAALAAAKKLRYTQSIENDVVCVGDRAALQRLTSVLLDNAVKYTPPEGEICLSLRRSGRKAELQVRNTCTLPEDTQLERLFDRFYRADPARSGGQSFGIGLSIARAIAENHRGSLRARWTAPGEIAFTFLL